MTKIDIFSGFLGAGKTTLIKKLIKEAYAGEKVVLIENEFGEIGIDGGFLQDAGIEITEMNSGCICCSLVGDFTAALGKVLRDFAPDRVIIEPSGVGKLSDVIRAAKGADGECVLNCFTTVADVTKCRMYMKNFGEFYNDQIANASAIVLSHTDVAKDAKIEEAVALIREHNPTAVIVTTPWDSLDGKDILAAMEHKDTLQMAVADLEEEHREHAHHHHHHDHDEECHCHEHHHEHDEECHCHEHHHDHDEECHCHEHHHEHDEECHCHEHHHDHDEECHCHEHHHEHDEECHCHEHHHDHDEECHCHEHHHDHDEECHCHEHHHEHHHDHGEECSCGCHGHHGHHADEVFTSFGAETTKKFTKESITAILEAFDESNEFGTVLRAKGIVACECGKWLHFDYGPGGIDVRCGTPGVIGRLCVIGAGIDEKKIKELFGI